MNGSAKWGLKLMKVDCIESKEIRIQILKIKVLHFASTIQSQNGIENHTVLGYFYSFLPTYKESKENKGNVTKKHEIPKLNSTGIERFKLIRSDSDILQEIERNKNSNP